MSVYYDSIAEQYKKSKELPFRFYIESYTYFKIAISFLIMNRLYTFIEKECFFYWKSSKS